VGRSRGQYLRHLVDHALGLPRVRSSDVGARQQQFLSGSTAHPDPLGRTLQALDGFGLADLAVLTALSKA